MRNQSAHHTGQSPPHCSIFSISRVEQNSGNMFLSGNHDGVIVSVQQMSVHGTIMMDVAVQLKSETVPRSARLGPEAVSGALTPGAAVVVTFLMNVVTSIRVICLAKSYPTKDQRTGYLQHDV